MVVQVQELPVQCCPVFGFHLLGLSGQVLLVLVLSVLGFSQIPLTRWRALTTELLAEVPAQAISNEAWSRMVCRIVIERALGKLSVSQWDPCR